MEIIRQSCNMVCVSSFEQMFNGNKGANKLTAADSKMLLNDVADKCPIFKNKLCKVDMEKFPDSMVFRALE